MIRIVIFSPRQSDRDAAKSFEELLMDGYVPHAITDLWFVTDDGELVIYTTVKAYKYGQEPPASE